MNQASWPSIVISSWDNFVRHASEYTRHDGFVFRGIANAEHNLCPSLLRFALAGHSPDHLLELEQVALAEFMAQAHLHVERDHLPDKRESPILWWAVMQHFAAPTRFLDWTRSPFVAAYFAVEKHPAKEGVIVVVDEAAVQRGADEAAPNKGGAELVATKSDLLFFWSPPRRSHRLNAQQGLFSVNADVSKSHDGLAEVSRHNSRRPPGLEPARLWVFPPAVKDEILKGLRTTNIAAHSLFPGLDGLGRSIGEIARLWRSGKPQFIEAATIESTTRVNPPSR